METMKMKLVFSLALTALVSLLTGCIGTVDGHSTAAVPLVKDKIIRRFDRSPVQLATATKEVLSRNGKLLAHETIGNSFMAKISESTVWVKLTEVEPKLTEVTVQVRTRGGRADIDMASELSTQIALQLMVTP